MTDAERQLDPTFVRECFETDEDGQLIWARRPRNHFGDQRSYTRFLTQCAGKPAGRTLKGYVVVALHAASGKCLRLNAHRIVWLLHTGNWPEQHIDHINRVRHDNRIENLRDVPPEVNMKNNGKTGGTGLTGAFPKGSRFVAKLQKYGQPEKYLGTFGTAEEAHAAYLTAKAQEAA